MYKQRLYLFAKSINFIFNGCLYLIIAFINF